MNKNVFNGVKPADAVNDAGGIAYSMSAKHAIAQLAVTGCFNGTYYASGGDQLAHLYKYLPQVDPTFIAKTAVYSATRGLMKDMPVALLAYLAGCKTPEALAQFKKAFPKVVTNGKMIRNFVQAIRSNKFGRQSFGTSLKKQLAGLINSWTDSYVAFVTGSDPSMSDIIKMVHPKPVNKERENTINYVLGREFNDVLLPDDLKAYELFKKALTNGESVAFPEVPFEMLTSLSLTDAHWKALAKTMTWNQLRINLNTLLRHKVFEDKEMVQYVVSQLMDAELVKKSRTFPYQLFTAYMFAQSEMPREITIALQKALDYSAENIPEIEGKVWLFVDVSGSMSSPVTGQRGSATSKVSCCNVAGLFAASILRKNPTAEVIQFATRAQLMSGINPLDSIATNAREIGGSSGGGTSCSTALAFLNQNGKKGDLCIYLSDNESWVDSQDSYRGTSTMDEWKKFKQHNPGAKLVCIDLAPNTSTQAHNSKEILNVGGFSDSVYNVISMFMKYGNDVDQFVEVIESIDL